MKIILGSDHAGYELKCEIKEQLHEHEIFDVGCDSSESVDYPDYGKKVAREIASGNYDTGILICGTGIGMSITANRFKKVRAALCHSVEAASATRAHNDANILCLGSRTIDREMVPDIVKTFLSTSFEGERHKRRIDKIDIS